MWEVSKLIKKQPFRRGLRLCLKVSSLADTDERWNTVVPNFEFDNPIYEQLFILGWNTLHLVLNEDKAKSLLREYDEEDREIARKDFEILKETAGIR